MNEREMQGLVDRAIRSAQAAWSRAHEGLPTNPMTRTAAIPAVGALAAAILSRLPADDEAVTEAAYQAILMARRALQEHGGDAPSNPMARTAERAAVGAVAAGIVNHPGLALRPEEGCAATKS